MISMSNMQMADNDDEIQMAIVMTINDIVNSGQFSSALAEIGSRKFFASLAVDAWFNEDFVYVRRFLAKSIIFDSIQRYGASRTLSEISERRSVFERIKGVLQSHNAGLKGILEYCTDGSCTCISFSQIINEEKELFLNPNADREAIAARRKQREDEKLPPILQSNSEYWTVKKKAAAFLKKGEMGKSSKLYLQAKCLLEEHKDMNAPSHQKEWLLKIAEEVGKVASNLSLICLRKNMKRKALQYADEAVLACPGWSKAYCRRAAALQSLGRLDEAQVAIFNAEKKLPQIEDADSKLISKDCVRIQKEIEAELRKKSSSTENVQKQSPPLANPLHGSLTGNEEVMDIIVGFLSPLDFAHLEKTCKKFAKNNERNRRVVIGSKLLCADNPSSKEVMTSFFTYINAVEDNPTKALQSFLSEVHPMISGISWERMMDVKMDPLSFATILAAAFSNSSEESARLLFDLLDIDLVLRRDFQIAAYILRGDNTTVQHSLLNQISYLLDDESNENFYAGFFQHSLDLEVMRLAMSFGDDFVDMNGLKESAFIMLHNSILVKGSNRRQRMTTDDPIYTLGMECHAIYTENTPDDWPGLIDENHSWANDSIERDSIKQTLIEDKRLFLMWKAAILKLLNWVHKLEKAHAISDFLVVYRLILGEYIRDCMHSPISVFSFSPFLIKKSVEFGGAISMSVRLNDEDDLTDFFHEYYEFLKLFRTGFQALHEYSDRIVAAHHVRMG